MPKVFDWKVFPSLKVFLQFCPFSPVLPLTPTLFVKRLRYKSNWHEEPCELAGTVSCMTDRPKREPLSSFLVKKKKLQEFREYIKTLSECHCYIREHAACAVHTDEVARLVAVWCLYDLTRGRKQHGRYTRPSRRRKGLIDGVWRALSIRTATKLWLY